MISVLAIKVQLCPVSSLHHPYSAAGQRPHLHHTKAPQKGRKSPATYFQMKYVP